ncbi:MAG: 2-C-methyl-D-erythritol 2,4-cyclodiphosphate synthase [Deltaproteobacteria bacterium]|nr:2-C-methyl-D-erythritol 2,4-cyclodiphosphate synthase [Deltaproteobacteria bacterium]
MYRIGLGYDIHPLVPGRPLILGGVEIPFEKGLKGHSDADAVLHALCDALLGALNLGDLGKHFPDTDPRYRGISSRVLLKECYRLVQEQHYGIANLDCVVMAERPKLRSYIDPMRQNIAEDLNIELNQVSIKASTANGLGSIGAGEGIAVQAIILLIKR